MARVTLRQLMTMSAGFQEDDSTPSLFGDVIRQDGDAVTVILKRGLVSTPGETFAYSSSSAHLVSAVLAQALRQADGSNPRTVLDYAIEKLFKPLGIGIGTRNAYTAPFRPDDPTPFENAGFGWATDAQGINIGAGQLRLRPADMLKFGQLYLDHGKWLGNQLVPEEWVAASVAPSPASSQYGLMWWLETTPAAMRRTRRGDSADRCRSRAPTSRRGRLPTHQGLRREQPGRVRSRLRRRLDDVPLMKQQDRHGPTLNAGHVWLSTAKPTRCLDHWLGDTRKRALPEGAVNPRDPRLHYHQKVRFPFSMRVTSHAD
jgi:CubicO group peptidase (beta-lactamase class C family)